MHIFQEIRLIQCDFVEKLHLKIRQIFLEKDFFSSIYAFEEIRKFSVLGYTFLQILSSNYKLILIINLNTI